MPRDCALETYHTEGEAMRDYMARHAGATFEGFARRYTIPQKNMKRARRVWNKQRVILEAGGAANIILKDGKSDYWVRQAIEYVDKARGLQVLLNQLRRAGIVPQESEDVMSQVRLGTSKAVNFIRRNNVWSFGSESATKLTKDGFVKRVEDSTGLTFDEVMTYIAAHHSIEVNTRNTEYYNRLFNQHLLGLYDKLRDADTQRKRDAINRRIDAFRSTYLPPVRKGGMVDTRAEWLELERRLGTDEANRTLISEEVLNDAKYAGKEQLIRDLYEEMDNNTRIPMLDTQLRSGHLDSDSYPSLLNGTSQTSTVRYQWYIPLQVLPEALEKLNNKTSRLGKVIYSLTNVHKEGFPLEDRYDPFISALSLLHTAYQQEQSNDAMVMLHNLINRDDSMKKLMGITTERTKKKAVDTNNPFGEPVFLDFTFTGREGESVADAALQADNSLHYVLNGEVWVMKFPIPKDGTIHPVAQAFKYVQRLPTTRWGNFEAGYLNLVRQLITTRNPAFAPFNFFRDAFEAIFNISSVKSEEGLKGLRRRFLINLPRTLTYLAVSGSKKHTGTSQMDNWYQEAKEAGMFMYFADVRGFEREAQEIEKILKEHEVDNHLTTSRQNLAGKIDKAGWEKMANALDNWSEYWESATRFAVFVSLRQKGVPVARAARHAREITLNFEQKGLHEGQLARNLVGKYLFFNAGIQSVDRGLRTLRAVGIEGGATETSPLKGIGKRGVKVTLAAAAFGFVTRVMQRLTGDEDDDIWQDRHKLDNYFLFKIPTTETYLTLPKPYTIFRVPITAGEYLADVMLGYEEFSPSVAATRAFTQLMSAIDPIGMSQSTTSLTPTMFRPIGEALANRNWADRPVVPAFYSIDGSKPFVEKTFFGDSKEWTVRERIAQQASDLIYDNVASAREHNPDVLSPLAIDHMISGYLRIGAVGELQRSIDFLKQVVGDDDPKGLDYTLLPVVRRGVATERMQEESAGKDLIRILESKDPRALTEQEYRFVLKNIKKQDWTSRTVKRFRNQFQDKFGERIEELGMQRIINPIGRKKRLGGTGPTAKERRLPN